MKKAITSSYCQVGVYPFDSQIVLRVIKKYQVHLKNKNEKKRIDELKEYLEKSDWLFDIFFYSYDSFHVGKVVSKKTHK